MLDALSVFRAVATHPAGSSFNLSVCPLQHKAKARHQFCRFFFYTSRWLKVTAGGSIYKKKVNELFFAWYCVVTRSCGDANAVNVIFSFLFKA